MRVRYPWARRSAGDRRAGLHSGPNRRIGSPVERIKSDPDRSSPTAARRPERSRAAPEANGGHALPALREGAILTPRQLIGMQGAVGNRAVARLLAGRRVTVRSRNRIRRVQISIANTSETLYSGTGATGDFAPQSFGGPIQYQMDRNDAAQSVSINVRIKFVSQARDPNGASVGPQTALADNDPRRGFASSMCTQLVGYWNNKFALVGEIDPAAPAPAAPGGGATPAPAGGGGAAPAGGGGSPAPSAGATPATPPAAAAPPTPAPAPGATPATPPAPAPANPNEVRLRLVFQATPVFDPSAAADNTVAVFGAAVRAGGAQHPIDAGNWYMNRGGDYSAPLSAIYAHEYGHLLGLQDEYSRSNHQMHRLMHRYSPTAETTNNAALDRGTVSRMVLQAVQPALETQIRAQGGQIAAMFTGQRDRLIPQLADALGTALRSQATVTALLDRVQAQYQEPGQEGLQQTLPQATAFELFQNLSNYSIARTALTAAFSPNGISDLIIGILGRVIATKSIVEIPNPTAGQDPLRIAVEASPRMTSDASLAASASALATNMMGTPAAGGGGAAPAGGAPAGGAPPVPVYPSNTILRQLQTLSQGWAAGGASLGALADEGQIRARFLEAAVAGIDIVAPGTATSAGAIYRRMYRIVNGAARAAAMATVTELLGQAIRPTLEAQASQLLGWVEAETQAHTTATGTGTNANPNAPASPALLAAVQQMEGRMRQSLQAAQTPAATGSEEPAPGTTDQPVLYTAQGLMGENAASTAVRPDMMTGTDTITGVVQQFNSRLKRSNERDFRAQGG